MYRHRAVSTARDMMKGHRLLRAATVLGLLASAVAGWAQAASPGKAPARKVVVFAAASTTDAMQDLGAAFKAKTGVEVESSFAASSLLARQIENGAPAQVFVSADQQWMDYLQERRLLEPGTRRNLLANKLVLIAPKGKGFPVRFEAGFDLAGAFKGRLAVGDPEHVPAGIYGRQALMHFGWWKALQSRLAPAQNVRAALRLVEMGEADAGIVYESDAKMSGKVEVVGVFPESSCDAVVYPAALVSGAGKEAEALLAFLSSPDAAVAWRRFGFTPVP